MFALRASRHPFGVSGPADGSCAINSFSPTHVTVGTSPVTTTFSVSTSGCTQSDWTVEDLNRGLFAYKDSPQFTFEPVELSNTDAGLTSMVVTADNADGNERQRTFNESFDLERRTEVSSGTMNASPEPVKKGGTVKIDCRFAVVDWDAYPQKYVPFAHHHVAVQFRTPNGTYSTVKVVETGSDGWVHTTSTQEVTGLWRVAYLGTTGYAPSTVNGDSVTVS